MVDVPFLSFEMPSDATPEPSGDYPPTATKKKKSRPKKKGKYQDPSKEDTDKLAAQIDKYVNPGLVAVVSRFVPHPAVPQAVPFTTDECQTLARSVLFLSGTDTAKKMEERLEKAKPLLHIGAIVMIGVQHALIVRALINDLPNVSMYEGGGTHEGSTVDNP